MFLVRVRFRGAVAAVRGPGEYQKSTIMPWPKMAAGAGKTVVPMATVRAVSLDARVFERSAAVFVMSPTADTVTGSTSCWRLPRHTGHRRDDYYYPIIF